jgi:hypothetical protein
MTQIRQDFEVMAELLLAAASPGPDRRPGGDVDGPSGPARPSGPTAPAAAGAGGAAGAAGEDRSGLDVAGDALPAVDRIVLYVDDLDRCPPRRVVEVLEAVHLLLAGRLFVVVVAVDPRWLLRSITSHYRELFDADHLAPDDTWTDGPTQYLEKIFQIVLTLPPLDHTGYQRLIESLVGVRADQKDQLPPPEPATTPPDRAGAAPEDGQPAAAGSAPRTSAWSATVTATTRPELRTVLRVDPLALTPDELRLLALLGPPLITSPRAVKRLTNSYGVLAACRPRTPDGERRELSPVPDQADDDPPVTGTAGPVAYPYRAGLVLLAAVVGYPDLGPEFFTALHRAAHTTPAQAWTRWLETQLLTAAPNHTDPRQSRLHDLITALQHVDHAAAAAELPLPRRLDKWSDWVIPVGRLSFPTGPTVTRLMNPSTASQT